MRKLIASAITLAVVAVAAPAAANAVDVSGMSLSELQDLLASIEDQIADLSGDGDGVAVSCSFTRSLYPGMSGADVQCLQEYLNAEGYTVASSGVGSPGNETQYYGSLTQAAVGSWQDANGVAYGNYRGYFGPVSQAKYNQLAAADADDEEEEEDEEEDEEEEEEEDEELSGDEGSLVVTKDSSVGSGNTFYTNTTAEVLAIEAEAGVGSDVRIERLDLNFDTRPWLYMNEISLWNDGEELASIDPTESNVTEVTVGSDYKVRMTDVDLIVKESTSEVITVKVDTSDFPSGVTADQTIDIDVASNAVRATDAAGITIYEPGNKVADGHNFILSEQSTATIQVSVNDDSPTDHTIDFVNSSSPSEDIVLLRANVKAENNDLVVNKMIIELTASTASTSDIFSTFTLYDGEGNALQSTSSASATTTENLAFNELDVDIAKDETKTFVLKGDAKQTSGNSYSEGEYVSAELKTDTSHISAEDATSYAAVSTISGSNVSEKRVYLYEEAPSFALSSRDITLASGANQNSGNLYADFEIEFDVTANGNDIYIGKVSAVNTPASNGVYATTSAGASVSIPTYDITSTEASEGTNSWRVPGGTTKTMSLSGRIQNSTSETFLVRAEVSDIKWAKSDSPVGGTYTTFDWGITGLRTSKVTLEGK